MKRRLQALLLSGPTPTTPVDMSPITPEQAVELIDHTAKTDAIVEIYLVGNDDEYAEIGTPHIGLVFEGGKYTGFGLGGVEATRPFEISDKPIELADFAAWVS